MSAFKYVVIRVGKPIHFHLACLSRGRIFGGMGRGILMARALVVFGAMPAYSQNADQKPPSPDQVRRQEAEKAYQRTLKATKTDAPAPKVDPWGSVRGTDTVQPKQK